MILDIAANLLNENFTVNEAADAVARQGVTRWLKNEFPYTKFGRNPEDIETGENDEQLQNADGTPLNRTNIQSIFDKANFEFGHPLNAGLEHRMKFTEKYLPGAVRIAFTDCGWMTRNENTKMMENLKSIYAALFFNWWDGCEFTWVDTGNAETSHWEARNPSYKGLVVGATEAESADFNGMSYQELYNEYKSLIPAAKERLTRQSSGTEEEEEAPPAPVVRNNTPYNIEFIPDFETSKKWKKYTNQVSSGSTGCTWCITSSRSFWNDYHLGVRNFAYYCWKAPSLDALLEMNTLDDRPGHYFSFCRRDANSDKINNAPLNEYGRSLIAVMVYDNGDGQPTFKQATSRYNHYGPDGEWHNGKYGDNMVPQNCDDGYRKILQILEMDDAEFKRTFKIPNGGNGTVSHDRIMEKIRRAQETHNVKRLFDELTLTASYNNGRIFRDNNQYNFIRPDGTLLSNSWFESINVLSSERNNLLYMMVRKNNKFNIVSPEGRYLLERDVLDIAPNNYGTYAKVKVKPNLYNIVNLNTGLMLLKKPVRDLILQDNYSKGIFVREAEGEPFKLINLRGKVIYEMTNPNENIVLAIRDSYMTKTPNENGTINVKIVSSSNGKVLWRKMNVPNSVGTNTAGLTYIIKDSRKFADVVSYTGKVLIHYTGNNDFIENRSMDIYGGKTNYTRLYDRNTDKYRTFNAVTGEEVVLSNRDIDQKYNVYIDDDVIVNKCNNRIYKFKTSTGEQISETRYTDFFNGGIYAKYENDMYSLVNSIDDKVIMTSPNGFAIPYNSLTKFPGDNNVTRYLIVRTIPITTGGQANYYIFDENYEQVNKVDILYRGNANIWYIGYNCFGYTYTDGNGNQKSNILGPNGKWLFKREFNTFDSTYFNDSGIISIKAGNKDYFVNSDGDVSRSVEALAESFVDDDVEDILVESETVEPVVEEKEPDHDVVYISSLFMN